MFGYSHGRLHDILLLTNINENISHIDMFYRLMSSNSIICVRNVAMYIYYASIERKQYLDIYMYLLCCNIDLVICFSTPSHCSLCVCMYVITK